MTDSNSLSTTAQADLQKIADQELEACCEWLNSNYPSVNTFQLRANRRITRQYKALKEQANALLRLMAPLHTEHDYETIRRALEALPDG